MMAQERIGGGRFMQLTGCRHEHVRLLVALKVIHPIVADSGWRLFTADDVKAARRWMAANARERASA